MTAHNIFLPQSRPACCHCQAIVLYIHEKSALGCRLAASPEVLEQAAPQVNNKMMDAEMVDITSAYSVESGFQEMTAEELSGALQQQAIPLLLDVRSGAEFSSGHVQGAQNISLDTLSNAVKEGRLDEYKDKPVAVMCQSGMRSSQATVRLTKVLGFQNVTNVKGGVEAWMLADLQLVTSGSGGCGCGKPVGSCS